MAKKKTAQKVARVRLKRFKVADLEPAPYNARVITMDALAALTASLERFGLLALPVVNERDGEPPRIIGGHQRINILKEKSVAYVWCIAVNFSDALERQANFALNNEEIQGVFVPELTREVLDQIREHAEVGGNGAWFRELRFPDLVKQINRALTPKLVDLPEGEEEDALPSSNGKSVSSAVHGVYQLGKHLLYCGHPGDETFKRIIESERPRMGVGFFPAKSHTSAKTLDPLLQALMDYTDGAVYLVTGLDTLAQVQVRWLEVGGYWSMTLLWQNPETAPAPSTPYKDALFPVLYGWPTGSSHVFYGGTRQGNTLTLRQKPSRGSLPVDVAEAMLLFSTQAEDVLVDVHALTGSILVAAERMERRVRACAPNAKAADLIRRRWTAFVHGEGADWKEATPVWEGTP